MTELDGLRLERDGDVATITLDVPEKLNRLSMPARNHLAQLFEQLGSDEGVRAIVLTGAGEKAFTAGGDIAGFLEREPEELSRLAWNVAAPERCPKPVIAKLRGFAFGVGLELALACDFRIAAENAKLGQPEILLGIIPGGGGTQRLARQVGAARAKDLILTGRQVGAAEAERIGLVDRVVSPPEVLEAALSWASELARGAVVAQGLAKRAVDNGLAGPLAEGLALERDLFVESFRTEDAGIGIRSFLEQGPGKASFVGR
jgi:2-oxoglutaroyl-CoA hydrolase